MLQSQSLELVTIVTVINVVIDGFSGEDLKWLAHVTVRLQVSDYSQLSDYSQPSDYTVRLQLCRLIRAKYTSLCSNHIWENYNCYDYYYSCIFILNYIQHISKPAMTSKCNFKLSKGGKVLKPDFN